MAWKCLQVTLGAGATQVSTAHTQCRQVIVQNNAAHSARLGDATVSATNGQYLAAGPGGGAFNSGPSVAYNSETSDFWLFGTAADVIDVFVNT
jgi:hypothetical protein